MCVFATLPFKVLFVSAFLGLFKANVVEVGTEPQFVDGFDPVFSIIAVLLAQICDVQTAFAVYLRLQVFGFKITFIMHVPFVPFKDPCNSAG